jgi:hypothetical protein
MTTTHLFKYCADKAAKTKEAKWFILAARYSGVVEVRGKQDKEAKIYDILEYRKHS